MRGKLTDQDLTNYALNDGLGARERLYVESMLGLNEECRGDVYKLMDLGQMLEEGFEQENTTVVPMLTAEQRLALTTPQPRKITAMQMVRYAGSAVAMAACVALAIAQPAWLSQEGSPARAMSAVSSEVARVVNTMRPTDENSDYAQYVVPTSYDDEDSTFLQASSDSMPADDTICTPPSLQVETDSME